MRSTVWSVGFDPSGKKLVSGSSDETVKVWSIGSSGTFECESTLTGHSNWVRSVCFSADGKFIASGSDDRTVKIWSAGSSGTFECQSTLTGHRYVPSL